MQQLISLLRLTVGFALVALLSLAFGVAMLAVYPFRRLRLDLFNVYGTITGLIVIKLAGATVQVRNRERLGRAFPAIYIGNHTSALDAFIFFWLSPLGVTGVVKREIARIPFFGQLYWLSGNLLIDRKDKESSVATLKAVVDFVRAYKLGFMIMPEGTRSRDGRLLPFKTGFVHLAIDMGLPVVPTVLHGVHKSWMKGTVLFQPTEVEVEVLEAVDTSTWKHETAQEHADSVHALYAAALREDQKPRPVGDDPAQPQQAETYAPAVGVGALGEGESGA